jgi:dipeptidyl aminopeptidase/acylaminoacyl peptidase
MKKLSLLLTALVLFACKQDKKNANSGNTAMQIENYTIEQFMDNESVGGGSFSPDNSKLLISSNRTGIFNVYTVPSTGGNYTPITASDSTSYFAISYFPKDERMLLRADNNGDEIFHIFLRDTDGSIKDLTPFDGARSLFYGWKRDLSGFYYGSNKRDARFMDLYEVDIKSFKSKMLYQNNEGLDIDGLSSDGKTASIVKPVNTNDNDLFLFDLGTKKMTKVNDNLSFNSSQDFSLDGKYFYYTTDDGSEFQYLMKYDIATGKKEKVKEKNWDITNYYTTYNETYQVLSANEDGKTTIEVTNTETGEPIEMPDFGNKSITGISISRDESMMRMYVGGSNTPSNLYTYNLTTKKLTQITNVLNPEINEEDLVTAKVVRYPSFDDLKIPAIYYLPHQASEENKVPAMVWVHGGPGGQSRQSFSALIQYMVNQGYAVLAVNNRGSSGYGKTFYQMDDQNHGDKDLKDCIAGKDWLATQPQIDADKIGIIGGSYGGFMTMAALTSTPEEFDVGVNIFGVTNWMRTLKSIPPWWESFKDALYKEMGDPYSADSVRIKEISPLFHTDKVTKPLIVLQGSQDPRVLQVESDEIVAGVRKNGVPVEYVLFEDEGHGFVKKENQIEAYSRIVKFLDKYLKKEKTIDDGDLENTEIK